MPMAPFYEKFRDLAFQEMRSITLPTEQNGLPAGTYGFLELYCNEPGCDCRYVFISVVNPNMKEGDDSLAMINYGWEDVAFYKKWMGGDTKSAREMKGPGLTSAIVRQPKFASALLDLFKVALQDPAYVERLKRHYRMFREAIDEGAEAAAEPWEPPRKGGGRDDAYVKTLRHLDRMFREAIDTEPAASAEPWEVPGSAPSRNGPCPCGSGRKYKVCCGKDGAGKPKPPADDPNQEGRLRERLKDLDLPRNAERPPSEFLKALVREFPNLGAALARLAAHDEEEKTRRSAAMLILVATRDSSVPATIRDRITRAAILVLRTAFKDPQVSDECKYKIGPLLEECGVDLPQEEYESCFHDFHGTVEREGAVAMKEMSPSAESVEAALGAAGLIQDEKTFKPPGEREFQMAFGYGVHLRECNPEAGAFFLAVAAAIAAEYGKALSEAEVALSQSAQTRTPAVAWRLSELSTWPGLGRIGEKAGELAAEMRGAGIAPQIHSDRPFSHGIVSGVDGVGSRSLMLFFRAPAGRLDALGFLLNDEIGMKDTWCAFDEGAKVEEQMREATEMTFAPVSLPLARELIENALALHQEQNRPPPGRLLLHRPCLGGDPLRARKRLADLGAYALEVTVRSPDLAAGSEDLVDGDYWENLWCASDEAYDFVRGLKGRKRGHPVAAVPELIERFIREVAIHERGLMLSRMATNIELEAWAGRAGDPMNRLAARTWLTISEELCPFHEVPFIQALARRALEMIQDNLDSGFRTQREANEAALARTERSGFRE